MTYVKTAWQTLVNWFEHGDLIPLLVIVSAAHYTSILSGYDKWPVAVSLGILVDIGHYRVVRAAIRYNNNRKAETVRRWIFLLVMTGISFGYHYWFYNRSFLLAAPIPLLIGILAWLQRVDVHLAHSETKSVKLVSKVTQCDLQNVTVETNSVTDGTNDNTNDTAVSVDEIMKRDNVSRSTAYRRLRKTKGSK